MLLRSTPAAGEGGQETGDSHHPHRPARTYLISLLLGPPHSGGLGGGVCPTPHPNPSLPGPRSHIHTRHVGYGGGVFAPWPCPTNGIRAVVRLQVITAVRDTFYLVGQGGRGPHSLFPWGSHCSYPAAPPPSLALPPREASTARDTSGYSSHPWSISIFHSVPGTPASDL